MQFLDAFTLIEFISPVRSEMMRSIYEIIHFCQKCKLNRTLYNTQLIQFARIPAEFVVRFIRYQYRMEVMTFSIAA